MMRVRGGVLSALVALEPLLSCPPAASPGYWVASASEVAPSGFARGALEFRAPTDSKEIPREP